MNHSIHTADRATHLKIVVVALVAGIAVAGFGFSARSNSGSSQLDAVGLIMRIFADILPPALSAGNRKKLPGNALRAPRHLRRALDLLPVKRPPVNRPFDRLEEND